MDQCKVFRPIKEVFHYLSLHPSICHNDKKQIHIEHAHTHTHARPVLMGGYNVKPLKSVVRMWDFDSADRGQHPVLHILLGLVSS